MNYGVILFHTTSAALRAEKILTRAQLAVKPIPPPREFSSDCGIALRFEWNNSVRVKALLNEARVEVAGIHQIE